jgi:hypothetical protein
MSISVEEETISVDERSISIEELLSSIEELQGLPEIGGLPGHGEVQASCDYTCGGKRFLRWPCGTRGSTGTRSPCGCRFST